MAYVAFRVGLGIWDLARVATYDAATGTVVLFGGYHGDPLGGTWVWGSNELTLQPDPTDPAGVTRADGFTARRRLNRCTMSDQERRNSHGRESRAHPAYIPR
jgi:hypothetical protein